MSKPAFHKGRPEPHDVHLATLHLSAWNKELGISDDPRCKEIDLLYIERLAQLIRYVRRNPINSRKTR